MYFLLIWRIPFNSQPTEDASCCVFSRSLLTIVECLISVHDVYVWHHWFCRQECRCNCGLGHLMRYPAISASPLETCILKAMPGTVCTQSDVNFSVFVSRGTKWFPLTHRPVSVMFLLGKIQKSTFVRTQDMIICCWMNRLLHE